MPVQKILAQPVSRTQTDTIRQNRTTQVVNIDFEVQNHTAQIDTFEKQSSETTPENIAVSGITTPKVDEDTSSMSTGKKIAIFGAVLTGALLAGELLLYKGKHLKKAYNFAKKIKSIAKAGVEASSALEASKIPLANQEAVYQKASEYVDKIPKSQIDEVISKVFQKAGSKTGEADILIGEIAEGILPKNGIYYHGTKTAEAVTREGLSLYRSNQLHFCPREFGAGIYITPDRRVASSFAGIRGRIIPIRAAVSKTAMVNEGQFKNLWSEILAMPLEAASGETRATKGFANAVREMLARRIFMDAGYDSVYTARAMTSGSMPSADTFIGRAQSQLVVFDSAKIQLGIKKTFARKMGDEALQIDSKIKLLYNTVKWLRQFIK